MSKTENFHSACNIYMYFLLQEIIDFCIFLEFMGIIWMRREETNLPFSKKNFLPQEWFLWNLEICNWPKLVFFDSKDFFFCFWRLSLTTTIFLFITINQEVTGNWGDLLLVFGCCSLYILDLNIHNRLDYHQKLYEAERNFNRIGTFV